MVTDKDDKGSEFVNSTLRKIFQKLPPPRFKISI